MCEKLSLADILQQITDINEQLGHLLRDFGPVNPQIHGSQLTQGELEKLDRLQAKVSRLQDLRDQLKEYLES